MEANNKMREALQQAKDAILAARKKMGVDNPIILEIIDAALAAPPRNCDVGTEQEQARRFLKYCVKQDCEKACPFRDCKNSHECAFAWAQMPYEEGGAK